jgi:hypothetical protein
VTENSYEVETVSRGASLTTTYSSRRVQISREEVGRAKRDVEVTSTLRSYASIRNGRWGPDPILAALLGQKIGVRVGSGGRFRECIGLDEAKGAITQRLSPDGEGAEPLRAVLDRTLDESRLKRTWDETASRYHGRRLAPGDVVFFHEVFEVPTVPRLSIPYVSMATVVGPAVVKGRPGVALTVEFLPPPPGPSLDPSLPTTLAVKLVEWCRRSKPRVAPRGGAVSGHGRVVVATTGTGLLDEWLEMNVTLTGGVAALAGRGSGPRVRRVRVHTRRQREIIGPDTPVFGGATRRAAREQARSGDR